MSTPSYNEYGSTPEWIYHCLQFWKGYISDLEENYENLYINNKRKRKAE